MMKKLMFAIAMCGMLAACSSTTEETSTNEEPKKEEVKEEKAATPKTTEDTNETSEEANTTEATEEETTPEETPAEEPAKEESNDPGISKEEFDKIQNGMTVEEVVSIIGGEGELQSETGAQGDQFYTSMYGWEGESGLGANAIIMFQGSTPKVESKSQFGLE
ncbi:hypothetical protein [Priestia megaterium]|uniref:hypothetical protein n=1 Tax=Priestia megaterium TaxID=1404 RepID=UPI003CC6136E